jgi:hypothetical protein
METKIKTQVVELENGIKLSPDAIKNLHFLQTGLYPEENCVREENQGIRTHTGYIRDAMVYIIDHAEHDNSEGCKAAILLLKQLQFVVEVIESFRVLSDFELRMLQLKELNEQ